MTTSSPAKTTVLRIAVASPVHGHFDYLPNTQTHLLTPGMRVRIPFGRRQLTGIVLETDVATTLPASRLKAVDDTFDEPPVFDAPLLQLIIWASRYYHAPLGQMLHYALPQYLRQGKCLQAFVDKHGIAPDSKKRQSITTQAPPPTLNPAQQVAFDAVLAARNTFRVFALKGVTGSGKTEVYLRLIERIIPEQQVLILVPEIGLTPQMLQRFEQRFDCPIAVIHSGRSPRQRLQAWLQAKHQHSPIVLGTRSSIFTPLPRLGLIIIDEEHDPSFKQQEGTRYSARDLAIKRAANLNIPIVLGSATLSFETLHNAARDRYQLLSLPYRAGQATLPTYHIIDLKKQALKHSVSPPLLERMKDHLARGQQVLLFVNRRGYAPCLLCHDCGWVASCCRCDAKMTVHYHERQLRCHHCDTRKPLATRCADCQSHELKILGLGTERLENVLQEVFPEQTIARIDRDTVRKKGELKRMLQRIHANEFSILVGTQMLAKGHHFPNVTLVAILDADSPLFSADFRATERLGQLVVQVAGRAGREATAGEVMIQTHHPEHPLLHCLLHSGYDAFSQQALNERRLAELPPYHYCALLRAESTNPQANFDFLQTAERSARAHDTQKHISLLGPIPAAMHRRAGHYRAHLLLKAPLRHHLQAFLHAWVPTLHQQTNARRVRWIVDVDPQEVL